MTTEVEQHCVPEIVRKFCVVWQDLSMKKKVRPWCESYSRTTAGNVCVLTIAPGRDQGMREQRGKWMLVLLVRRITTESGWIYGVVVLTGA